MPIIGNVGRRSFKVRFLNVSLHVLLVLGAITMVYPFAMMVSGSMKSRVDQDTLDIVPAFLYDDNILYKKWIEAKYNETLQLRNYAYRERSLNFRDTSLPERPVTQRYADWQEFIESPATQLDHRHVIFGSVSGIGVKPELARKFLQAVKAEDDVAGSIHGLNEKYGAGFANWDQVSPPILYPMRRSAATQLSPFEQRCVDFGIRQPPHHRIYHGLDSFFTEQILRPNYGQRIEQTNKALGTHYTAWSQITLARTVPNDALREDWLFFVRNRLNLNFIQIDVAATPDYRRYLRDKYKTIDLLNTRYEPEVPYKSFDEIPPVKEPPPPGIRVTDWDFFVSDIVKPEHISLTSTEFMYRDFLMKKYGTIEKLIAAHEFGLKALEELPLLDRLSSENTAYLTDWLSFMATADLAWLTPDSAATVHFKNFLTQDYQKQVVDLVKVNKVLGERYKKLEDVPFPATRPTKLEAADLWDAFGSENSSIDSEKAALLWQRFLARQFPKQVTDFEKLNAALETRYDADEDIYISRTKPKNPKLAERWVDFVANVCPKNLLIVDVNQAQNRWREFIKNRYAGVAELNETYGYIPAGFDKVNLPAAEIDYYGFLESKGHSLREFMKRNYAVVFEMMVYNGSAILNTCIYCVLAVLCALLVNPLAAYALSRYKPPSQYKILLFLMLTMAFPPMVLGIPSFLLLRKLQLLNTFAALVLPAMANGYHIFLLKGFFDALPRELYESAQIDGATEWTMFWEITMSTSKPILAVIALGAFQMAYANFMMAFLVCQNPKMWTIMVHLYQLQQRSSQSVIFASIVVAAIPTLLIFIFCQNIILRGIVVPTEK